MFPTPTVHSTPLILRAEAECDRPRVNSTCELIKHCQHTAGTKGFMETMLAITIKLMYTINQYHWGWMIWPKKNKREQFNCNYDLNCNIYFFCNFNFIGMFTWCESTSRWLVRKSKRAFDTTISTIHLKSRLSTPQAIINKKHQWAAEL